MQEPRAPRRPISTIGGLMIAIAVFGLFLGIMVVNPFLFILVVLVAMEAMAIFWFRRLWLRKPMSVGVVILWIFGFVYLIPVVLVIASFAALFAYCIMNPEAFR